MRKRWYFPKKMKNSFFQSQMDESNFLEDIKTWKHPPWYREHPIRGESNIDFLGIWRVSTSSTLRLTSGCRWRKLHIPPSRWTQSQTLLAERRNIPCSTEIHWRLQNYSYELRCYARATHRWLLEYRWVKRFVLWLDRFHTIYSIGRETYRRMYVVRGDKTASDIQATSFTPRALDEIGKKC